MIGYTAGEGWLGYMGVPDYYPRIAELTNDVDDAMWDAARQVLDEWKEADPLLRVMADDRCKLWTKFRCQAGTLPVGTMIEADGYGATWLGQIRDRNKFDHVYYEDEVYVRWESKVQGDRDAGFRSQPTVRKTTEVDAWVPVPFDMSALLDQINHEEGITEQPAPARSTPRGRLTANQQEMLDRALRDGEVPVPADAYLSRRTATSLVRKGLLRRATGERWGPTYRPTAEARRSCKPKTGAG